MDYISYVFLGNVVPGCRVDTENKRPKAQDKFAQL